MIKKYKASELRRLAIAARAVYLSRAGILNDLLAVNRLWRRMRDAIEIDAGLETDLDALKTASDMLNDELTEEARKKTKNNPKKGQEELAKLIAQSDRLKEIGDKEDELMNKEVSFALDSPIKFQKFVPAPGGDDEIQSLMPKYVEVQYRSPKLNIDPWHSLMDLVDEGLVELVDQHGDEEEKPIKKTKR